MKKQATSNEAPERRVNINVRVTVEDVALIKSAMKANGDETYGHFGRKALRAYAKTVLGHD